MLILFVSALLMAGESGQPPATTASPVDPMDKMVCRRQAETGSLVRAKRECHTRRQWAYLDEQNQTAARNLVDDGRSKGSVGN